MYVQRLNTASAMMYQTNNDIRNWGTKDITSMATASLAYSSTQHHPSVRL